MNGFPLRILTINLSIVLLGFALLGYMKSNRKLGNPGVKAAPSADPLRMDILLPTELAGYRVEKQQATSEELTTLPSDTSISRTRYYKQQEQFFDLSVVLMGTDRTSIHQPQFCLTGQGWRIDSSEVINIPMEGFVGTSMPVMKLLTTKDIMDPGGKLHRIRGVFTYWFVAEGLQTAKHGERMWMMAKGLFTSGVLQRWAYITCFSPCYPGQEQETEQRLTKFLQAAVPTFQLPSVK